MLCLAVTNLAKEFDLHSRYGSELQLIWTAGEFCSLGSSHSRESEAFILC